MSQQLQSTRSRQGKVARINPSLDYWGRVVQELRPELTARQCVYAQCWMLLERGSLGNLSQQTFNRELRVAIQCINASSLDENEGLARSYGYEVAAPVAMDLVVSRD